MTSDEPEIIEQEDDEKQEEHTVCSQLNQSREEGSFCSICFERYTSVGAHRVVCLRCGHLFGKKCISRWLSEIRGPRKFCPTCKQPCRRSDVREHYCRGVQVVDNSELHDALMQLEKHRQIEQEKELQIATLHYKCLQYQESIKLLEAVIENMKRDRSQPSTSAAATETEQFLQHPAPCSSGPVTVTARKCLEINKQGENRVMDFCRWMNMLICSCANRSYSGFGSYGITKVDMLNERVTEFVPLNGQQLRDIRFHPSGDGTLLTASLDGTLKLTSARSNSVINSWKLGSPVWSCCWKANDANNFFCGTANGKVKMFDIRMPRDDVNSQLNKETLLVCDWKKPIVSLRWFRSDSSSNVRNEGVLMASSDRCIFYVESPSTGFKAFPLPAEGKITSVVSDDESGHFLVSFGPSMRRRNFEHLVCNIVSENSSQPDAPDPQHVMCNIVRIFNGGTINSMLSRNCLFTHQSGDRSAATLAAIYDESENQVKLWDVSTGEVVTAKDLTAVSEFVPDLLYCKVQDTGLLNILTRKRLCLYTVT